MKARTDRTCFTLLLTRPSPSRPDLCLLNPSCARLPLSRPYCAHHRRYLSPGFLPTFTCPSILPVRAMILYLRFSRSAPVAVTSSAHVPALRPYLRRPKHRLILVFLSCQRRYGPALVFAMPTPTIRRASKTEHQMSRLETLLFSLSPPHADALDHLSTLYRANFLTVRVTITVTANEPPPFI
ncbi:hypothetical protein B0H14DRAFT_3453284 [Mycena olivaceomarginata]|nr:hypothetical protein B0H14DRAFT_3453284 [Mycena olivaceomarginata]